MSDLQSTSDYRDKGLLTWRQRLVELRRIIGELRSPNQIQEITQVEVEAAHDLCYRLYSEEVADLMAAQLGVTRQRIREALDAGLRWAPPG